AEYRVFLRDGLPVGAQVGDMTEPIGRILLEIGAIDQERYDWSLAQITDGSQRQGDVLLSAGAVTEDQVTQACKLQLLRKLTRLFKLREAQFAIYREDHEYGRTPEEAASLRVHPRRVIYHGVCSGYDLRRLRDEVGSSLETRTFQ